MVISSEHKKCYDSIKSLMYNHSNSYVSFINRNTNEVGVRCYNQETGIFDGYCFRLCKSFLKDASEVGVLGIYYGKLDLFAKFIFIPNLNYTIFTLSNAVELMILSVNGVYPKDYLVSRCDPFADYKRLGRVSVKPYFCDILQTRLYNMFGVDRGILIFYEVDKNKLVIYEDNIALIQALRLILFNLQNLSGNHELQNKIKWRT